MVSRRRLQYITFIESYFNIGGKQFLINDIIDSFRTSYSGFRAAHSVVAYFLGVVFFEKYKEKIKQFRQPGNDNKINLFVLFLTFLYHDFYYYKECDGNLVVINEIESKLDVLNIIGLDCPYDPASIKRYYEYRNRKEHGIYAGYMLNKRLKKHLDEILVDGKPKVEGHLYWSMDDIPYYDLASSAIIKHNIWLANSDSDAMEQKERVACYEEKGLEAFIINNKGKIKFKDNPLLFMLFIIDTIEPVKMLCKAGMNNNNGTYEDLLLNIRININKRSVRLQYIGDFKSIGCHTFCEAKKMETWMNVTVSQTCTTNASTLIIEF